MKRILFLLFLFLVAINLPAQIPEKMSYQAVIRNSSDKLITNGNIAMRISLLQGSATGTVVYSETISATTNANGLVSIEIGGGTVVSGNYATIDWSAGPYFLKTETDPAGGTNYSITGTTQLLSVPYSIYAKTAETIKGGIIETDPLFLTSPANTITTEKISDWNNQLNSVNKIPSGDSLVLRDNQGVIRMVMNPNTGTFKMMNNDTVWYSISVNSPHNTVSVDNQGNVVVKNDNLTSVYSPVGKLMSKEEKTSQPESEFGDAYYTTTKTHYDNNGNVTKIDYEFDGAYEKESRITTFSNGDKIVKSTKTKPVWGRMKKEVSISKNDKTLYKEISNNGDKEIFYYNDDGSYLWINTNSDQNSNLTTKFRKFDKNGNQICENYQVDDFGQNSTTFQNSKKQQVHGENSTFVQSTTPTSSSWYTESNGVQSPSLKITPENGDYAGVNFQVTQGEDHGAAFLLNQNGSINLHPSYPNGYTSNLGNLKNYGNLDVFGDLNTSGTKNFRINNPLDTTKYLVHASIESNEVLNKYSGNIVTDQNGEATVYLPDYFESINIDFRYQLTVIGSFAQAIIAEEIENNRFLIKTDKPKVKVSWEVTGKRNDRYMTDNQFEAVVDK